jgi:hypothetical protein
MDRLELRLSGGFVFLLVALGLMSCGFAPLVIWLVTIKDYPKAIDAQGVTLRNGRLLPWKELSGKRKLVVHSGSRQFVAGVSLTFGKVQVKIAPRALQGGERVLPYLGRILGEDLTRP